MRSLLILLAVIFSALALAARAGPDRPPTKGALTASPHAIVVFDGDTIEFDGHVIELAGIDAPELGQTCRHHDNQPWKCGLAAAYELRKRLELDPRPVLCQPQATVDGAIVATCVTGGEDLSAVSLESGYVVARPDAFVDYRLAEQRAQEASLGLWGSRFVLPWQWREQAASRLASSGDPGECVVKGIAGTAGANLYYGPLDPTYADLQVDPARGDRWFCSNDAARAAGWRRPGEKPS